MRRGLGVALLLAAAAMGLLWGCGVREDSKPQALRDLALPADTAAPEAPPDGAGPLILVYLVRDDLLSPVERTGSPALTDALRLLMAGPRATETRLGFRSAIPEGTRVLGVSRAGGVVTIDLSEEFTSIVGPEQMLALAQIVYTATSAPGTEAVRLAIEGDVVDVTRADGSVTAGPVTRADFARAAGA